VNGKLNVICMEVATAWSKHHLGICLQVLRKITVTSIRIAVISVKIVLGTSRIHVQCVITTTPCSDINVCIL